MKKKLTALAAMLSISIATSACSGSAETGDTGTLTVGTIPNPSVVAIYLGKDQGMFEEAGIKVVPKIATGFAPNLAAVVNGESQVGFAAVVPLLVAKSKGAPIKIIAGTDAAPKSASEY
ncbi:MAG: hypothetical protein GEU97_14275 [Actinophytocola sp.]|nr:hypothetical protein [Actinophytocola sp.]